jgi:hypothetical protein
VPLAQWRDDRLVEIRQRGISRHVAATKDYLEQVRPEAPQPLDETLDDATGPIDVVTGSLDEVAERA